MESLHQLELGILLLGIVLALTTIARKYVRPYPIPLAIGVLLLALVPGLPMVTLSPGEEWSGRQRGLPSVAP